MQRMLMNVKVAIRLPFVIVLSLVSLVVLAAVAMNTIQTVRTVTVEIEGEDKPACVADWITRLTYS